MGKEKNAVGFGIGLIAGVVGGLIAGVLYAPKPGKESREKLKATVEELLQKTGTKYSIDSHYDYASAFQKSLRGSDADAAIYYLAKMLTAGEDPRFIALAE